MIKFLLILGLGLMLTSCGQADTDTKEQAQKPVAQKDKTARRPNILIAISDDHSFKHTSVNGSSFVQTPNLDRIANEGFLFNNAYSGSPGCSPSRAALLTGQHHWMIGPAGTHGSSFPAHYETFVDLLEEADYKVGFTGKGWGPGDWLAGGRTKNPAGVEYNEVKLTPRATGISNIDYAENFRKFMDERKDDEPFYFWYGANEPHLPYLEGPHPEADKAKVTVPGFLPDTDTSRSMLLDYADEINYFDDHLGKIIAMLEEAGELDNTLIIVTADNGMPMPRAKSNGYDYGIHVPLAIRWGNGQKSGQKVDDVVGFVDLSATILETAGIQVPDQFVGHSLAGILNGKAEGLDEDHAVFSGRERHSSSRYQNMSYPQRMMRIKDHLIIWNAKPDLDPAGAPRELLDGEIGPEHGVPGFLPDTDTSRSMLLDYADEINYFDDHLGKIIAMLEEAGELDNTLIIVTADNGMPMPRAKSNGYDYGIHVPLAIRWGNGQKSGQKVDDVVGFVDLSATILETAGIQVPDQFVGHSLAGILNGKAEGLDEDHAVFSGRERHSSSRYQNMSYPQRMMRIKDHLIIWNAKPDLDPAGAPRELLDGEIGPEHGAYYDIDDSMIKREVIGKRDDPYINKFFHLATDKRPEWQMFNVKEDPFSLVDLGIDPAHADLFAQMQKRMMDTLKATGDARVLGYGYVWEDYPRTRGPMRQFPKTE